MLVAVSWPSQSEPTGNLVVNGSFEPGLAPWGTLGGGSLERTTRQARFGAASGAVTARTDERAGIYWYGAVVRPRRGDRYTLTVWVRAARTADNDRIVMELIEHAGGFEDRHVADAQLYLDPKWKRTEEDSELKADRVWTQREAQAIADAVRGQPAVVTEE